MERGVRQSVWTAFFLAGMAFMAALVWMLKPELFSTAAVRERPGNSIVVGAHTSHKPEPEAVAPPVRRPAITPRKTAASQPTLAQPSAPAADVQSDFDPKSTDYNSEVGLSEPLSGPVTILGHIAEGGKVVGVVRLTGELPPLRKLPVTDGFCGPNTFATTIVSRAYLRG